ncbi:MAG: glycoside hydrolase family 36 protein [Bryobacteraceae bacterium]|jgi:alpha-galactosidase
MLRSAWPILFAVLSAAHAAGAAASLSSGHIRLEFNAALHSRVIALFNGKETPIGPFTDSETIRINGRDLHDFALTSSASSSFQDRLGAASRLVLRGISAGIEKAVTVDSYPALPYVLFITVEYTNKGNTSVSADGWTSHAYRLDALPAAAPAFWSLQSGSYEKRPDWIVPLTPGFSQQNYLGMNADDYGGGTPVSDVWRRDVGLAVGHVELQPKLVSLPVAMPAANAATVAVEYRHQETLAPGQSLRTFRTFVAVHQGDCFATLRDYRRIMLLQGVQLPDSPDNGFEPIWCAWGFGRGFQVQQIDRALPTVKSLGFKWVTLDDGWQTAEGDWNLNPNKFPDGDAGMQALVARIHAAGLNAQLWWSPMSVSPKARLFAEHADWLLLDLTGARRKISWWDSYYLCPALPAVVSYHQRLVQKILAEWGFDGLKIDGQFLNAAPPCTNPTHRHHRPEDAVEAVPLFFKAMAETARAIKPGTLIELCPCGTSYSFYSMPYYNMTVASDPESSWQIRTKGKVLKALMGDTLPYFGDHVELSDGGNDFASTVGVGGVIGTEFRWPPDDTASPPSDTESAKLALTPEKAKLWASWVRIYREKMLPKGEYVGALYDIGFDRPEAHVIRKQEGMYYAFFAPKWTGAVELRGLSPRLYRLTDYVHGRELGTARGPKARIAVQFRGSLLIAAIPQ